MAFFGTKKKQVNTLDGIIRGLNYAFNSTDQLADEYYRSLINRYFTLNEVDQIYDPKTVKIRINPQTILNVPIITLIEPKEIGIDSGEIEFYVNGTDIVDACDLEDDESHQSHCAPQIHVDIQPLKDANNIKFNVKFSQMKTSEGFMRIVDAFNNGLSPEIINNDENKED